MLRDHLYFGSRHCAEVGFVRDQVIALTQMLRDASMAGSVKLHRGVIRHNECLLWAESASWTDQRERLLSPQERPLVDNAAFGSKGGERPFASFPCIATKFRKSLALASLLCIRPTSSTGSEKHRSCGHLSRRPIVRALLLLGLESDRPVSFISCLPTHLLRQRAILGFGYFFS